MYLMLKGIMIHALCSQFSGEVKNPLIIKSHHYDSQRGRICTQIHRAFFLLDSH